MFAQILKRVDEAVVVGRTEGKSPICLADQGLIATTLSALRSWFTGLGLSDIVANSQIQGVSHMAATSIYLDAEMVARIDRQGELFSCLRPGRRGRW